MLVVNELLIYKAINKKDTIQVTCEGSAEWLLKKKTPKQQNTVTLHFNQERRIHVRSARWQ